MIKNNIFTFDTPSSTGIHWFTKTIGIFLSSTNVGIIAVDSPTENNMKDIYLIDSGPDKKMANLIFDSLKKEFSDFSIKAVIDTHSHADHCGANSELVRLSGCKIYSTLKEKSGIECPENQSAIAYGGYPLPEYLTSYYLAEPSIVDKVIKSDEEFIFNNDTTVKCIALPGHYYEMIGVLCSSKENGKTTSVFFTSDGIFTRGMLAKYWIPFLFNVGQFKESLNKIKSTKADFYVPSHGDIYTETSALYELNMISVLQNEDTILQCLKEKPATFEDILKYIADINEIPMRLSQFMLVGSTIRSYISYLYSIEKISWVFKENKMYWRIKKEKPLGNTE